MCIRRGKQPRDWDDSNFKSKQKAGWRSALPGCLTPGFDAAAVFEVVFGGWEQCVVSVGQERRTGGGGGGGRGGGRAGGGRGEG